MPDKPTLLDFFRLRFGPISRQPSLPVGETGAGTPDDEKIVMACFLHDISNGALVRCDHGYWRQLVAPTSASESFGPKCYH